MSTPRFRRPIRKKGVIAAAQNQWLPVTGSRLDYQADPWVRKVIRPILIALLATSVAIAMLVIVTILVPDQSWQIIAWLAFFAALEGAYTAAWLDHPDSRVIDRTTYRAAELFVLVVIARIFSWIVYGSGSPTRADIQAFLESPSSFFMVGNFFTTVIIVLLTWWLTVAVSRIFSQLDVSEDEVRFYTLHESLQKAQADNRPIQISRGELQTRYLTLFLSVGMGLIILAALSTYEVREFATVANPWEITRLGLGPGMLTALLLYFLSGLWLLSHARLLRMNARWLMDGVTKEPKLERAWQWNSFLIILLIALVAAFLPIGSTLAISQILRVIVQGIMFIVSAFYGLIGLAFASMLALLSRSVEPLEQEPLQPLPTPIPPQVTDQVTSNPIIGMVFSSIFWTLFIALVIGATVFVLNERGYRLETKRLKSYLASFTSWLHEFWLTLRGRVRATGRNIRRRFNAGISLKSTPITPASRGPRRFLRVNSLPPREQVRFFYLSTVRRAGELGIRRRQNETPLEYVSDLKDGWPEAEGDLKDLTDAFLEARYNSKPIALTEAASIKERWKRIRARLRNPAK